MQRTQDMRVSCGTCLSDTFTAIGGIRSGLVLGLRLFAMHNELKEDTGIWWYKFHVF